MMQSYRKLGQDKLADDAQRAEAELPEPPGGWTAAAMHYRSNWWKLIPLSNRG